MAEFGVVASSKRSARTITAALLTVALAAFVSVAAVRPAAGATALECRADRPVGVGDALIFRVREPEAGSTYQWSGYDGLSATGEVITWTYGSAGWKLATVSQVDSSGTVLATASCGMHVLPPPGGAASVAPVLWVPADVDPAPLLPQLDRVWRSIRAAYYQHYGRTFVLEPVQAVRSASTEQDICGGDCTDVGRASTLMNVAFNDANAVAPAVPFRRYQFVMSWGAGGWAGSWGWDIAKGGVGDWATATAAGVLVPNSEPNLPDWAAAVFGSYASGVDTMWHEANHGIGWDEDNSQFIDHPPTQWEQDVVAESPWLTEIPADTTPPSVSIITPVGGGTISGMTTVQVDANDSDGMDAVGLVVDGQLLSVATSVPYAFDLDTFGLSSDGHQLTAIAYDAAGNTAEQTVDVNVMNELGGACDTNPPVGQFYACMYTGTNFDTYLGTMVDGVDQLDTGATAWGPRHRWPTGSVFHGIGSQISGRWKGVVDLPEGNYLFHVLADDGVRLRVNGQLVLDEWRDQAERFTASASGLGGPTTIEVEWYQNFGGKALELWWQPTTVAPSVAEQPDSQSVPEGTAVSFTTAASGDPSPTVQWQSSTDGGRTFSDVPGATSPTLSLVAQLSDSGTQYRAVFTNLPAGQPRTTTLTEPATLTVTPPPLPLAPSSVTATPGVASATVSWAAPGETGGSPLTAYTVTASPGGATAIVDGATRSTIVPGLTIGVSYTFTVTATNAAGLTSEASAPSNAVTPVGGIDDDEASFTAAWQDSAATQIDLSQDVTLTCAGGEPTRDSTTAIVVYGHGHTLRQTCPTMRVLTQLGTGAVTVKNITITGGDAIAPGGDGKSGGAIGSAGDVFVTNATLTGNRTDVGHGGAVSTPKNVVVSNSTVDDNQGGRGGAIDAGGDVSVSDSTMTDNHASSDGGAIRAIGNVTVANSTIADNTAIHDSGGGIMAGGSTSITDSTLSGNVAGDDGGAVLSFGPVLVVNSTISNNVRKDPPPFFGNGVAGITAGGLTLVYATIVDNTGGIGTLRPGNALTSFGSVVTSPDSRPACRLIPFVTSVSSGGYNLDNDGTCGFGAGPSDRSAFTSSLELGALDDNGGPTSTRLPAPTSPLLDQIPLTACDAGQAIIADQRGIIRPQGDGCDQGAVEAVVPTPARPPGVPQSVSATPGDGSATVSWSPPDDDGDSPITAYTVTASPNGATATVDGATLSTTVPGLTNGVSYTFTVTATNAAGLTSETSAPSNAVTPASRPKPPKHHHHHHHHGHGQHGGHHCQHDRGHARGEHASAAHRSCRPPAHSKLTNGRRR